jgi:5'-nucleotidase
VRVVGGSNPLVPTICIHTVPLILLTNDDGIDAEGLMTQEESLHGLGEIVIVAPDQERSAVSHALTLKAPLTLKAIQRGRFVLDGTPADCVIYSLRHVLNSPPDLVISGINHGANLGVDIMYSGTVAAAREASQHGLPSIAISQAYDEKRIRFRRGARFVRTLIETVLLNGLPGGICLNVNIPVGTIRGVKITRQGCATHIPHFNSLSRQDDTGAFIENTDNHNNDFIEDYRAVMDQYISITPLQRDQTDYAAAQSLVRDASRLFQGMQFPEFPGMGLIEREN